MTEVPEVSVIIPTYNRGHVIERSLRSVLNQTYQDFEIIIVDDFSEDNTEDVVREIDDPRITYIRHSNNKGGSAARNTGIDVARGEFIAFQDSDAEWMSGKLEKQMRVMLKAPGNVGVVYSAFLWIKDNQASYVPANEPVHREGNVLAQILRKNFVDTATALVRKECFNNVGLFDENLPRYQDWDLFIRFARRYEFKYVDEPLVISYFMADSITANERAAITARKIIMDKNLSEIQRDKKLLAKFLFDTGTQSCKYGQFKEGREYIFRAIRAHCVDTSYWPAAIVTFFGQGAYRSVAKITSKI